MKNPNATKSRRLLALPAVVVLTVMALLMSTLGSASALDGHTDHRIHLGCQPETDGDQRGVLCKWTPLEHDALRGYQLYRSVDGAARELIASVGAGGRLHHFDTDINGPTKIVYGVVAVNRNGRVLAVSNPVAVQIPRHHEQLRMACHRDNIEGHRGILCNWSESQRPDARGYILYRSINQRERQVIAQVGLDGRTAHFDRDVHPGAVHIYYVAVVNAAGEVIGSGGPVRVLWPTDRVTDRATDRVTDAVTDAVTDRVTDKVAD